MQWDLITDIPQDWGNKLSESQENLVYTRTQEKGAVISQETEPDLPVSVQESPVKAGSAVACHRGQRHWLLQPWNHGMLAQVGLKEVAITAITPIIVWPQAYQSAENWIKGLLSMALPTRARPSFSHSQSCPPGNLFKPLILIHQRADRMKATIMKKLTQTDHLDHNLV